MGLYCLSKSDYHNASIAAVFLKIAICWDVYVSISSEVTEIMVLGYIFTLKFASFPLFQRHYSL